MLKTWVTAALCLTIISCAPQAKCEDQAQAAEVLPAQTIGEVFAALDTIADSCEQTEPVMKNCVATTEIPPEAFRERTLAPAFTRTSDGDLVTMVGNIRVTFTESTPNWMVTTYQVTGGF